VDEDDGKIARVLYAAENVPEKKQETIGNIFSFRTF